MEALRRKFEELSVRFLGFVKTERGQTLVEYALILVLVAIVAIGVLTILGGEVQEVYTEVGEALGNRP